MTIDSKKLWKATQRPITSREKDFDYLQETLDTNAEGFYVALLDFCTRNMMGIYHMITPSDELNFPTSHDGVFFEINGHPDRASIEVSKTGTAIEVNYHNGSLFSDWEKIVFDKHPTKEENAIDVLRYLSDKRRDIEEWKSTPRLGLEPPHKYSRGKNTPVCGPN